jgi:hypothetical protein
MANIRVNEAMLAMGKYRFFMWASGELETIWAGYYDLALELRIP